MSDSTSDVAKTESNVEAVRGLLTHLPKHEVDLTLALGNLAALELMKVCRDWLKLNDAAPSPPSPGDEGDARIAELRRHATTMSLHFTSEEMLVVFAALDAAKQELGNEIAFNEGWQEHISDLLDAMKPFVVLVKQTNGRIPTQRLSFANWHSLSKAFDAAVSALNGGRECKSQRLDAATAKVEGMRTALAYYGREDNYKPFLNAIDVLIDKGHRARAALAQAGEETK